MALTTITGNMVSVNAIQGTLIADNAITAVHIATNAVSGTLIADNAVTAVHIAQNSITVTQLADDCVESDKIADGIITTNHLNSAMISSQTEVTAVAGDFVLLGDTSDSNNLKKTLVSSIAALSTVGTGDITTAKIADDAVTGAKIENAVTIATSVTSPLVDGQNFKINGGQGTDGQLMTSTGSGVAWEDAPASGPSKGLAIVLSMIF
jgi:pyridoxal/pyridoxine/pyridoxamine kinase